MNKRIGTFCSILILLAIGTYFCIIKPMSTSPFGFIGADDGSHNFSVCLKSGKQVEVRYYRDGWDYKSLNFNSLNSKCFISVNWFCFAIKYSIKEKGDKIWDNFFITSDSYQIKWKDIPAKEQNYIKEVMLTSRKEIIKIKQKDDDRRKIINKLKEDNNG